MAQSGTESEAGKLPLSRQFKNAFAGIKASGIFCPLKGASGLKNRADGYLFPSARQKNDVLLWKQTHFWGTSLINGSFLTQLISVPAGKELLTHTISFLIMFFEVFYFQ